MKQRNKGGRREVSPPVSGGAKTPLDAAGGIYE